MTVLNPFQYDFWLRLAGVGKPADLLVSPKKVAYINKLITDNGMNATIAIEDVQK